MSCQGSQGCRHCPLGPDCQECPSVRVARLDPKCSSLKQVKGQRRTWWPLDAHIAGIAGKARMPAVPHHPLGTGHAWWRFQDPLGDTGRVRRRSASPGHTVVTGNSWQTACAWISRRSHWSGQATRCQKHVIINIEVGIYSYCHTNFSSKPRNRRKEPRRTRKKK